MQALVPVEIIPQVLAPIRDVVTEPQFAQIERLVRGILLVEAKRTIEAIRHALAERVSAGSLNHFLAESPWSDAEVPDQVWPCWQAMSEWPHAETVGSLSMIR